MGNAYTGVSTTYTPIEYIQSNGGQWIDTGFAPDSNTKIEMQVKFTANHHQSLWSGRDWNGASLASSYNTFFFLTNRTQARCDYDTNGTAFNYAPSVDTLLTYIQDKNVLKEGSTTLYTATATTFSITNSMLLFAGRSFDGAQNFASAKMYYCKIWDNDTLVRDFMPVIGSDGIPCLWDKVQGKAYYNEGYDGFSAGNVVAGDTYTVSNVARKTKKIYIGAKFTVLDYIESTGTQYIDTLITPNFKTGIEFKFQATTTAQNDVGMGLVATTMAGNFRCFGPLNQSSSKFYLYRTDYNGSVYNVNSDTNIHTIEYGVKSGSDTIVKLDNVNRGTLASYEENLRNTIPLFARRWGGNLGLGRYKLYYCKIFDNQTNELTRDFVPVLDNNNIACLYDKVSKKLFHNLGTGNFIAGTPTGEFIESDRKVKRAYIGVNNTARLVYDSSYIYDFFGNASKSDNTFAHFCVTHTTDYLLVSGGQQFNNTTQSTVTRAINENGVWTSCTNLPTRASYQGSMSVNGYGIIASGKTANSGASRTNQCIAYSNNLTQSTLSTVTEAVFESATASNDVHCVLCGGSNYSTTRSKQAQAYNASLVKTTLTDTTVNRRDQCGASLGEYIMFCGGYTNAVTSADTDFYNNNNVKTTGAYPYSANQYIWYNKGISNGTYAMFFGGRSTDNTNGTYFDDIIVYDTNLVSTITHLPCGISALQGFALGDAIFVGSGSADIQGAKSTSSRAYIYNNTLTVQKTINIPAIYTSAYNADANKKFGGFFGGSNKYIELIKQ